MTLVQLYKLQARPVWEYGAEFYLNTKKKVASLQRLQNKFLRAACPVARSAPVDVVHVVVNLELVEHRLELLQLKYLNRLALTPTYHPLFQVRAQLHNAEEWTGTYLPKTAVLRSAWKATQQERGLATDFAKSLVTNSAVTRQEAERKETFRDWFPGAKGTVPFPPAQYLHLKNRGQQRPVAKKGWEVNGNKKYTAQHPVKSLCYTPEELPENVWVLTKECKVVSATETRVVGFTDGSMVNFRGGVGVVLRGCGLNCTTGEPVNRPCNILECELKAISLALDYLLKFLPTVCKRVVLYSDCQVALRMVKGEIEPTYCSYQEVVLRVRGKLRKLLAGGANDNLEKVVLTKVRAHVGVKGNELADSLANEFRERACWGNNHNWTYCVADSYAKAALKRTWKEDFKEASSNYKGQSQFRSKGSCW